jgi:hypothetical protein
MIGIDSRVGQELKMGGILAQTKGQGIDSMIPMDSIKNS